MFRTQNPLAPITKRGEPWRKHFGRLHEIFKFSRGWPSMLLFLQWTGKWRQKGILSLEVFTSGGSTTFIN